MVFYHSNSKVTYTIINPKKNPGTELHKKPSVLAIISIGYTAKKALVPIIKKQTCSKTSK